MWPAYAMLYYIVRNEKVFYSLKKFQNGFNFYILKIIKDMKMLSFIQDLQQNWRIK